MSRRSAIFVLAAACMATLGAGAVPPPYRPVGRETGVRGKSTGFFHVEKIDGRDWIVDPVGRGVVLTGVDWCWARGMFCEALGHAPYGKFVNENYPSIDAWAEKTAARLSAWGFDFIAVGASPELKYRSLAHANGSDALYFSTHLCSGEDPDRWMSPYRHAPGTAFPNVFHPDFAKTCDELARKRCEPHLGDPWLVGYFLDNELRWWGLGDSSTGLFDLVRTLPESHSARKALEDFVAKSAAAGAPTPDSVKRAFVELVAERYFSTLCAAMRKADPDHMILGCRFAGLNFAKSIVSACGRHCDVVSLNVYPWADLDAGVVLAERGGVRLSDALREFHDKAGKPLLLTEWSFPALDSGLPCTVGAGQRFHTQAERVMASEMLLDTIFRLPFFVGHDFFMWQDDPPLGFNKYFHENSNYGLVNLRDEPYEELVARFARMHGKAARLRAEGGDGIVRKPSIAAKAASRPSERERFFARAAKAARAGASASRPVVLARGQDGSWTLSNGLVRVSGRVGGARMADEIAYGGAAPVGRWGALLEWERGGVVKWTAVSKVSDVSFSRDSASGAGTVVIRAEGFVGGAAKPAFAITDRLSVAPGSGEVLAEIVSLENLGEEPLSVRYLFLRPFAVEKSPAAAELTSVPDLWKGPVEAYWRLSDGTCWGVVSHDAGVVSALLWTGRERGEQHPDVRCSAGGTFTLAPGESYRPPVPFGAVIRLVSDLQGQRAQ